MILTAFRAVENFCLFSNPLTDLHLARDWKDVCSVKKGALSTAAPSVSVPQLSAKKPSVLHRQRHFSRLHPLLPDQNYAANSAKKRSTSSSVLILSARDRDYHLIVREKQLLSVTTFGLACKSLPVSEIRDILRVLPISESKLISVCRSALIGT